ncbi:hypothetical protein GCM10027047_11920 [Rhodococcus aerolatus]
MAVLLTLARGLVAGVVATAAKSQAEALLQPAAEALLPPDDAAQARPGADPAGHPERMPPAELVDRAVHAATGSHASDDTAEQGSEVLHWGMGIGSAVVYAFLRDRVPALGRGRGAVYGAAVFGATHASVLPAAGLQAPLHRLPRAALVWEPASHLVYGLVVDVVLRGTRA